MLHPLVDPQQRCARVRDRVYPNVVALECLYECLGHAVAFRAFDRRETRLEVQGRGNLKGAIGGEDRAIVAQPLHLAWSPDVAEPLLDTVHHHIPDHLAGDPGRCGHPANDLAVMAVQGKGDPHDLAIPAGDTPTRPNTNADWSSLS